MIGRLILTSTLTLTLGFGGCGTAPKSHHTRQARCEEDMPCWNWATMGNHRMGGQPTPAQVAQCPGEVVWSPATNLSTCETQGGN